LTYDGVTYPLTGFAFSKSIVTDLLKTKLAFKGYVNSDTGIINTMAWGLEDKTVPERVAAAINGGTDTLSGFATNKTIKDLARCQG
jgi:beta-glucosidase